MDKHRAGQRAARAQRGGPCLRYAFFVDVASHPEIRIYLEKDGVDFSEVNEDLDGVPVPGAGGTFLALTDTPASYTGRGGHVVLVKTTEDGIETQPWPVTGTTLNFFLSDDAADIGSYYYMYPTESGNGYSELTSPSLSTGDDQLLWSFVTEAGEPGVEVLALGAYTATLFLKKTGNKDVRLYWKLFKRDTGGTETEILQSAVSDYLTADNSQYLISAYLNEDQVLDPTDRLVLKLYANVSGTGTDVTVTLTMEGDYDSRLTINVLSSAFNLDRLSDVTISSPADNELLAYDSGSGKWINQTPSEAGIIAADGSVPLTGNLDADSHSINNLLSLLAAGKIIVITNASAFEWISVDTIADAISALDTRSGTIILPPLVIDESSRDTPYVLPTGTRILGTVAAYASSNYGTHIQGPEDDSLPYIFSGTNESITIENISFHYCGVSLTGAMCNVRGCWFGQCPEDAIQIGQNGQVLFNRIRGGDPRPERNGIRVTGPDSIIAGNQVAAFGNGIHCRTVHNLIVNNFIWTCYHGIYLEAAAGENVIGNNRVNDNDHVGIFITSDYNTCVGNVIYNNGQSGEGAQDGIRIEGNGNVIQGNQVIDTQSTPTQITGIRLEGTADYNVIVGNHTAGNHTAGIYNNSSGTNNDISHNVDG